MTIVENELETPPHVPLAEPGPLPKRVVETFTSPGSLFSRITPDLAPWVGPAVLAAAVMALTFLLVPREAMVEMMREQMQAASQGQPQGQAPDPASMVGFGRVMGMLTVAIYPFLGAVVVAGLLKLVFGAMMGGESTYGQYMSVYAHSTLIVALGSVVTLPIIMASNDVMRQLNLALLTPGAERTGFLFQFLSQFGVFNLWQYAVIAIGVHAVNRGRISAAAAWGGVAALYLLLAILPTLPALLRG